jgi:hypothetical protein
MHELALGRERGSVYGTELTNNFVGQRTEGFHVLL